MSARSFTAPDGYRDEDELPSPQIPDVPLWAENYWFVSYDGRSGIGVWLHLARSPAPHLWRETAIVYLPSGDVLLSRGHGPRALAPAALSLDCVQPWNRWSIRFDGAAVLADPATLATGLLRDGVHRAVLVELDWAAFAPVWSMSAGDMSKQQWGDTHYQQLMTVTGTVAYDGIAYPFGGTGIRDHTRGPRDYLLVHRHLGAHCAFPDSGRGFQVLDIAVTDGHRMNAAVVIADGALHPAEVTKSALLERGEPGTEPYDIELRWSGGTAAIHGEIVHSATLGFAGYSDLTFGYDPDGPTYGRILEGHTRFAWDGETAHGLTERSIQERETR